MKKNYILLFSSFLTFSSIAQTPLALPNPPAFPCVTNITTDPNAVALKTNLTSTQYADWKGNKFAWYKTDPITNDWVIWNNIVTGQKDVPFTSPFVQSSEQCSDIAYMHAICQNPDMKPEDGWELIKQDFGYLHNANDKTGGRTVQTSLPSVPYMVLYSKYKGLLRVVGYMPSDNKNFVLVNLSFGNVRDPNNTNNYKKAYSGLLAYYAKDVISPLDQNAAITKVSVPAVNYDNNPSATNPIFLPFFADFQLAYDPCTCVFGTSMQIEFQAAVQSSLNAVSVDNSVLEMQNFEANNSDAANFYAGYTPSSDADGGKDNNGNVLKISSSDYGVLGFVSNQDMEDRLQKYTTQSENNGQLVKGISDGIEGLGQLLDLGISLGTIATTEGADAEADLKVLENVSKILSFGSFAVGKLGESSDPHVNTGVAQITGTVTHYSPTSSVTIATPGSPATSDTKTNASEYTDINYPMYNEALGTFALLKTPTLNVYKDHKLRTDKDAGYTKLYFQLPINSDNIKFIFNPAVQPKSYDIRAALEIQRKYQPVNQYYAIGNVDANTTYLDIYSNPNTKDAKIDNIFTQKYTTPFVPLNCLSSVIPKFDYSTNIGDPSITSSAIHILAYGDANYSSLLSNQEDISASLKLIVTMEFDKINSMGKNNQAVLILKYPLNYAQVTSDPSVGNQIVQNTLALAGGYYYQNQTFQAWNSIDINGSLHAYPNGYCSNWVYDADGNQSCTETTLVPTLLTIQAGDEIVQSGESTLDGEIVLQISEPNTSPSGSGCTTLIPVSNTEVASFCNGSSTSFKYNAGTPLGARIDAEASNSTTFHAQAPKSSFSTLSAHPNPLWTSTTFYYKVPEKGSVKLYLTNGLGVKVAEVLSNATHEAGEFEIEYTNSSLPSGMYLVVLEAEGVKETIRLAVVR